jgi:alanine racemase
MPYHHLNTLTIFPDHLRHNLSVLAKLQPDIQPVPVLKSNGYGHGIKILAPMLNDFQIPFVCIDSLYEAFELEKNGYRGDILIMGHVDPRDIPRRRNFRYAVSSLEYALALVKKFSWIRLHLFLDTGMHREGVKLINNEKLKIKNEGFVSVIPGTQVPSVAGNLHDPESR